MERKHRSFSSDVAEVRAARQFVQTVLDGWGLQSDDVELVVNELAANAVRHAASSYEVDIQCGDCGVVVEVTDSSPQLPLVRTDRADRNDGTSGRGLVIVAGLANAWGVRPVNAGKTVWARFDMTTTACR